MFQLDDNFLKDLGLDAMPDDQKQAFLQHIYSELELRVGTKLSEGLNEQQMQEFESFVDQDEQKVDAWLDKNLPDYESQPDFQRLQQAAPEGVTRVALLAEYASLKWLELNRPDYRQVVAAELDKLKAEILADRDKLLDEPAQAA